MTIFGSFCDPISNSATLQTTRNCHSFQHFCFRWQSSLNVVQHFLFVWLKFIVGWTHYANKDVCFSRNIDFKPIDRVSWVSCHGHHWMGVLIFALRNPKHRVTVTNVPQSWMFASQKSIFSAFCTVHACLYVPYLLLCRQQMKYDLRWIFISRYLNAIFAACGGEFPCSQTHANNWIYSMNY